MLENEPGYESGGVKLIGCIRKSYKLIYNVKTNEKKLYDILKGEDLLKSYDTDEQRIVVEMSKLLTGFFNKLRNINSISVEALKSLGYLQ